MSDLKLIKELDKLEQTFKEQVKDVFSKEDKVAVKLHMGETNNPYYLKPDIIKKLINVLNELGTKPFLFDSPVIYKGGRDSVEKYYQTAEDHGFTQEKIGCPIVISNESVEVKQTTEVSETPDSTTSNENPEVSKPLKDDENNGDSNNSEDST